MKEFELFYMARKNCSMEKVMRKKDEMGQGVYMQKWRCVSEGTRLLNQKNAK